MDSFEERIEQGAALLRGASRTAAFTGAGISTESGLSDFRSPGGVWDRHRIVTYQEFVSDGDARREYWRMKRELHREMARAEPNRAHRALAELERSGRLACLVTQNIDGLHHDAGSSLEKVVEIHGTNRRAECLDCESTWPIEKIQERLDGGDEEPRCGNCGGLIKPATIMFGQSMPEIELARAFECAGNCDLLLMIGSSLQVEPAASIPRAAHGKGARLIYINRTPTASDSLASVIFREPAGETMGRLLDALGREE
ncbi:NAD-dependent deacetylase [Candidatus Moduliflexota bacterium]